MSQQILNNGESGLIIRGKINDNFTELYTGKDAVTVNTFADLPAPAGVTGQKYWVLTSTGVYLINRRNAGSYYSDGSVWTWLGNNPSTADQIGNVPAGNISATDVQAAINELDTEKLGVSATAASATQLATGRTIAITGDLTYTSPSFDGTGNVTAAGTIANDAVTFAKMQNSSAASILLGRGAGAGAGDFQEITLGTNLSMSGTTLNATGGGGGGSPGGNANEVQYNDGAGGFAGAANVEVDAGNLKLVATTDPTAPTGGLLHYAKTIAGRILPKIIGPSGIDTVMQVGLHGNSVCMIGPASGTTAPTIWGGTLTTAATMSLQQTIASSSPWLATARKRFATGATAGSATGMRLAYTQWFRGSAAGFGGFWFRTQFGQNINLNGAQAFVGLCASTALLNIAAGSAGALVNMIGMGYDTTDASTGNWFLMRNDGSGTATKVDLGTGAARANTTHGYDLIIYCPPGAATEIFVRVVNIHDGTTVLDTSYTTDIPAVNVGLAFKGECNNGAVASATNIEFAKVYIESDY